MTFDATAPVLALLFEPTDEITTLRLSVLNMPNRAAELIDGVIEAAELDRAT